MFLVMQDYNLHGIEKLALLLSSWTGGVTGFYLIEQSIGEIK